MALLTVTAHTRYSEREIYQRIYFLGHLPLLGVGFCPKWCVGKMPAELKEGELGEVRCSVKMGLGGGGGKNTGRRVKEFVNEKVGNEASIRCIGAG